MIFVTLGSQKFQFNRLLIKLDKLIETGKIQEDIFAQIGYSDYQPLNYEYKRFLDHEEFAAITDKSQIVITHGGTGAIIGAVKLGKKVIAVPRKAMYGEHVDDHQLQLVEQFNGMNLIYACDDIEQLEEAIATVKVTDFIPYISNTKTIIASIESFLLDK